MSLSGDALTRFVVKEFDVPVLVGSDRDGQCGVAHHLVDVVTGGQSWGVGRREERGSIGHGHTQWA